MDGQRGRRIGIQVERLVSGGQKWSILGTAAANATIYSDLSASPNTTFSYRVRAYNGSGASEYSNLANATTPAGITLAAAGGKEKGIAGADLTSSRAATGNVDIFRNGQKIGTVPNNGAYADNTGRKGTLSFTYRVCHENDCVDLFKRRDRNVLNVSVTSTVHRRGIWCGLRPKIREGVRIRSARWRAPASFFRRLPGLMKTSFARFGCSIRKLRPRRKMPTSC